MINVTEQYFRQYVKDNNLSPKSGVNVHSLQYYNEHGILCAYEEWSSWGGENVFQVKEDYLNENTVLFVTKIMNLC